MLEITDEDIIEWAADLLIPYAKTSDFCLYEVEPYPNYKGTLTGDQPLIYFKFRHSGTIFTIATIYGQDKIA